MLIRLQISTGDAYSKQGQNKKQQILRSYWFLFIRFFATLPRVDFSLFVVGLYLTVSDYINSLRTKVTNASEGICNKSACSRRSKEKVATKIAQVN